MYLVDFDIFDQYLNNIWSMFVQQVSVQVYMSPTGRPGPGPGSQAQTGGAASLRFIIFSMGFLHFGYAYALIGLEINIRLDLI